MTAHPYLTRSEQRLAQLESLRRPLTDEESDELYRALNAIYQRNRRHRIIGQQRNEELRLLAKLRAEAKLPSPLA